MRARVRVMVRVMVRVRVRVGGSTFAIDEVAIVGVVGDELADGGGTQRPDVPLDAHAALVARLVVLPESAVVIARARGPSMGVARAEHPTKEGDARVAKLVGGDLARRVEAIAAHLRKGGEEGARAALHRRLRRGVGERHVPGHRAPVHVARARALAWLGVGLGLGLG